MKVTEFMIGFGPRIFSFRRGDVEYGLKAIPAGAYVKIIGMANIEPVPPADEQFTYRQKSFPQRIGVAVAGSAMHFVLAVLLAFSGLVFFGTRGTEHWSVATTSEGSAAQAAGLQPGDRIVELDGVTVENFGDMSVAARERPGKAIDMVIERDGQRITLPSTVTSRMLVYGTVDEDLDFFQAANGDVRVNVAEESLAERSGMADGDVITALNGLTVTSLDDVRAAVAGASDGQLTLGIDRGASALDRRVDLGRAVEVGEERGFLGVGEQPEPFPVTEAASGTVRYFGRVAAASTAGLGRFFQPSSLFSFAERAFTTAPGEARNEPTDPRSEREATQATFTREQNRMSSIVGAIMAGEQLQNDWGEFLLFLAALNVVIGLFNLLPLPPFDGGHVVIATYERIREAFRRDGKRYFADANKLMPVAYGVVMLMLTVGLMAIYLDLADPIRL